MNKQIKSFRAGTSQSRDGEEGLKWADTTIDQEGGEGSGRGSR